MPDVCLVVPCFNEASRLPQAAFLEHLQADPTAFLCFVDDGSTDTTGEVLTALAAQHRDRIFVLSLPVNAGKAEAVRRGVLHVAAMSRFAVIGYWDADLATPLDELAAMRELLNRSPRCQLILGSRWSRLGAHIERSAIRHVLGRIFATAASLLLDQPVYDSQCGAKIFRSDVVPVLFSEPFCTRWLFDVEVLARLGADAPASRADLAIELPLTRWRDVGGSRLGMSQMAATPIDLLKIQRRYRRR
jgi:dolichyl-phosphate beta-glucosyltransferase